MKLLVILLALLITSPLYAECWTIKTARGNQQVCEGDVIGHNSLFKGTFRNLKNITFYGWNFSRKNPWTDVFINCENITLINCNLVNVKIPANKGFKVVDCNHIHKERVAENGKKYEKIYDRNDEVKIFEVDDEDIDVIERDFGHLDQTEKDKIRAKYEEQNLDTVITNREEMTYIRKEKSPNEKKIRVKDARKYSAGHIHNRPHMQ